jgi:hypothetical protein
MCTRVIAAVLLYCIISTVLSQVQFCFMSLAVFPVSSLLSFTQSSDRFQKYCVWNFYFSKHNKLDYTIYIKPTAADILIHNSSCHPTEHKLASINYLTNRIHSYPLSEQAKDTEPNTLKTILQNNQYKLTHIQQKPRTNTDPIKKYENKKWAIFTYTGREIKTSQKY